MVHLEVEVELVLTLTGELWEKGAIARVIAFKSIEKYISLQLILIWRETVNLPFITFFLKITAFRRD